MKIIKEKLSNGNTLQYHQLDNGHCYSVLTPVGVVEELEKAQLSGVRIRVFYGDQDTGRDWCEENDTMGSIGRSSGSIKIPLLLKTRRSFGGGALLDSVIVKITVNHRVVYEHPNYHLPEMDVVSSHVPGYAAGVDYDNMRHANFVDRAKARRFVAFIEGRRNCK
uniref:Uncharacterized protein n=1 Tax=viral metagenome TaxID=1070528 RepID=A0A6H1ZLH9_9ZZZZ